MIQFSQLSSVLVVLFLLHATFCLGQKESNLTPFEKNENTSATYQEAIAYYEQLTKQYPQLRLQAHGSTDSGFPLHTAILSKDQDFDPASIRAKGKVVLFINNGIHAGEPCGVDATMMLLRDYLQDKGQTSLIRSCSDHRNPFL